LRTQKALYVEYDSGDREFYDLRVDPYELNNLAAEAKPDVVERLSKRLAAVAGCGGAICRVVEDAPLHVFDRA